MSFNPLISLARNAKRQRMEMQCDPQWVLDLAAEHDQLRAELEAIRGQPSAALIEAVRDLIGAANSVNRSRMHEVRGHDDDQPRYWQRKEWVDWLVENGEKAQQALDALPPQQPDAVSVPREELEALRRDKQLLDAIQDGCWDVRYNSSPIADTGDYDTGVEVIGHFMQAPHERILGEDFGADVRKAIAQAMTAEAYPPASPEYDNWGRPLRALLSTKNAEEWE